MWRQKQSNKCESVSAINFLRFKRSLKYVECFEYNQFLHSEEIRASNINQNKNCKPEKK